VLKVKLGTFLPIRHCTISFNLKYIFVSLCKYSTTQNETFDMVQSCKSGRDFWVGPGSGLSLSKYFGLISGLHRKLFIALAVPVTIFFFHDVDLLCSPR